MKDSILVKWSVLLFEKVLTPKDQMDPIIKSVDKVSPRIGSRINPDFQTEEVCFVDGK